MTTAKQIIRNAFYEIKAHDANQTIPGEDTEIAIERLNFLVDSEPNILNFTTITSSSDEITSPAYANRWLIKALALDLAPQFGQLDSYTAIARDKEEAWDVVLFSVNRIEAPELNGNVPLGSGNRRPGNRFKRYYTESDNGVLTEQNETIVVEE